MEERKALGCFLASCCCRCNGASATWDIPHDIYPGEGIDRCFKAALWHGQERPLVTLDKAGDYHINLRAALPRWRAHGTSRRSPALPASRLVAHDALTGKERNKQLDKMLIATHLCVYMDMLAVSVPLTRVLQACHRLRLRGADDVKKLENACFPAAFTVYSTATSPLYVASFAVGSFCSVVPNKSHHIQATVLSCII